VPDKLAISSFHVPSVDEGAEAPSRWPSLVLLLFCLLLLSLLFSLYDSGFSLASTLVSTVRLPCVRRLGFSLVALLAVFVGIFLRANLVIVYIVVVYVLRRFSCRFPLFVQ